MMSKCGKNKKKAHKPQECVNDDLNTFWSLLAITEQTQGKVEYIRFIQWKEKNIDKLVL